VCVPFRGGFDAILLVLTGIQDPGPSKAYSLNRRSPLVDIVAAFSKAHSINRTECILVYNGHAVHVRRCCMRFVNGKSRFHPGTCYLTGVRNTAVTEYAASRLTVCCGEEVVGFSSSRRMC
jgi:hypothetical protein